MDRQDDCRFTDFIKCHALQKCRSDISVPDLRRNQKDYVGSKICLFERCLCIRVIRDYYFKKYRESFISRRLSHDSNPSGTSKIISHCCTSVRVGTELIPNVQLWSLTDWIDSNSDSIDPHSVWIDSGFIWTLNPKNLNPKTLNSKTLNPKTLNPKTLNFSNINPKCRNPTTVKL